MSIESFPSSIPKEDPSEALEEHSGETDEEQFRDYFETLHLTPEDLEKKILDVGAGQAKFAKWAKEHKAGSQIYSIDVRNVFASKDKAAIGSADRLPFADQSFDMVVSNGALPHVLMGMPNGDSMAQKTLEEMFRVVKEGGEIRLGKVLLGEEWEEQRKLKDGVEQALRELAEKYGAQIEMTHTDNIYHSDEQGNQLPELFAKSYFITIHKPKTPAS